MDSTATFVIENRDLPDEELLTIKQAHAGQAPHVRATDSRGLGVAIILDERARARTPSKQPFIKPL